MIKHHKVLDVTFDNLLMFAKRSVKDHISVNLRNSYERGFEHFSGTTSPATDCLELLFLNYLFRLASLMKTLKNKYHNLQSSTSHKKLTN